MSNGADEIQKEKVTRCLLCGSSQKELLYANLKDSLHGTPGEWDYVSCQNCGLVFLDPRPTIGDIGKYYAYDTYGTHLASKLPKSKARRLRSYVRRSYLSSRHGYALGVTGLQRLARWLIYLNPGERDFMDAILGHAPEWHEGRLLDVGCGSGENLNDLRRPGWQVEGVDLDPQAAESAVHNYGLNVRVGTLEDQDYPTEHFDVILMSQVIEHVHDPVGLLKECRRILKPNGALVVTTPNLKSFGHRIFGPNWRVMEPPRHLTVFSRRTLARAAHEAGLSSADLRSSALGAGEIFRLSRKLREANSSSVGRRPVSAWATSTSERLWGHVYQFVVWALLGFAPEIGEDLLMVAVKDGWQNPRFTEHTTTN